MLLSRERGCLYSTIKYFVEYSRMSDIHGMRHLGGRTAFERLMWGIIILVLLLNCMGDTITLYARFAHAPLVVSFATESSQLKDVPFPVVTICPSIKSEKHLFDYYKTKEKFLNGTSLTPFELKALEYLQLLCDEEKLLVTSSIHFTTDIYDTFDMLSPSLEDIMHKCQWLGQNLNCSQIFTRVISRDGVCYAFNIIDRSAVFRKTAYLHKDYYKNPQYKKSDWEIETGYNRDRKIDEVYPRRAFLSGESNSLKVTLKSHRPDLEDRCQKGMQGFKVIFGQAYHFLRSQKYFFNMSPNETFTANIHPSIVTTSPTVQSFHSDSRNCFLQSERFLKYFRQYTQNNCYVECLSNYTLHRCECVGFFMPRNKGTPICGAVQRDCMKLAKYELQLMEIKRFWDKNLTSYCHCLPSCAYVEYDIEISTSRWEWWKHTVTDHENLRRMRNNFSLSKLIVYFKSSFIVERERNEVFSIIDLVAKFGGLFGLYTGISVIGVIEIIYFLTGRLICNKRMYGFWTESDLV